MSEQIQNARMQQKRDITDQWKKYSSFVPKSGELIIYSDKDKDKNHDPTTPARLKIGDGVSKIESLPGIAGELYVQDTEPIEAGEGAVWINPDKANIDPEVGAASNWRAQEGEVGYIKNKPINVLETYVILENDEEKMAEGLRYDASDSYYSGMNVDMKNIQISMSGLTEKYCVIPTYFKGFLDLAMAASAAEELMDEGDEPYKYAIVFCGAGFLGMSLSTLAILLFDLEAGSEEMPYEILAISNDIGSSFNSEELAVGTHFYASEATGAYISTLKFNYYTPEILPQYGQYFKDGKASNVQSIGTVEDWLGVVYGSGGDIQTTGVEIAKRALIAELQKYKKGDILLVPQLLISLLTQLGG